MATYQLVGALGPGVIGIANRWSAVTAWSVQSATPTQINLLNSDGTLTRLTGTGFTLDGGNHALTGTVTGLTHLLAGGFITTETITGVSIPLINAETNVTGLISGALSSTDTINGSGNLAQILYGFDGADTFTAGAPIPDAFGRFVVTYVGGDGADTFNLGGATADDISINYALETGGNAVAVNLGTGVATDTFGATDNVTGLRNVIATNLADTLTGGPGQDTFSPGGGVDTINGGGDFDQISYSRNGLLNVDFFNFASGITATFTGINAGNVIDPTGAIDTFTNVERIRGTNFSDTFVGGVGNDSFRGVGGADTFDGGAGYDDLDYRSDAGAGGLNGVNVNLATGTAIDGFGATDTILNHSIERVRGTQFADTLTGDTLANELRGEGGNDTLNGGDGNDELRPGGGTDTLIGGAGFDRVSYSLDSGPSGVTFNVTSAGAGTAIDMGGATDTFTGVEGFFGTNLNDTMTGSSASEEWGPGRGNDTVTSNGGGDYLNYISDDAATSGITLNFAAGTVTSAYFGTDTLIGPFERVYATQFGDTLTGGAADETFLPSLGVDVIDGGGGADRLEYWDYRSGALAGIVVNMGGTQGAGTVIDAGFSTDTFSNIEFIRGGWLSDTFNGSATTMTFSGLGASNNFNGGSGYMIVSYEFDNFFGATTGVVVNLASTGTNSFGGTDTYTNVDRVNGGLFNDTLTGDGQVNALYGNGGNDRLDGAGGADTMVGGVGDDTYFVDNGGDVVTEAAGAGTDTAFVSAAVYTMGANVEKIYGVNAGGQTIVANDQDNLLQGAGGSNTLYGLGGADLIISGATASTLDGGAGNDQLYGGAGNDYMIGGDGDDTLVGFGGADSMYGGAGNDYIVASDGAGSVVDGGAGANILYGAGGNDYAVGGEGADLIVGAAGSDYQFGNAGDDTHYGGQGMDFIYTNAGNDFVWTDDVGLPQTTDFVYAGGGTGVDTIADFIAGSGANHDVLVVSPASGIGNFTQLMAAATQVGVYTVITMSGGDQVYLYNVQPFQLTPDNFLFF